MGCATFFSGYNKELLKNDEFDNMVKVEDKPIEAVQDPQTPTTPKVEVKSSEPSKPVKKQKLKKGEVAKVVEPAAPGVEVKTGEENSVTNAAELKHQPDIEDSVDFVGRRPLVDPFSVGEKVVLALTYFGVEAGSFEMSVEPFKEVNGSKSYHFKYKALSSQVFSWFYKVDDTADTYLSYDELVPSTYVINVKESGQVRDTRGYFDWKNLKGFVWDKKIPKDKPLEEKKIEWKIESFAQSPLSVAFYFRIFKLHIGKEYKVRVANEGENMIMTIKVLRKESLTTAIGKIDTLVIKPTFEMNGIFKPTGENLIWVTNDDKKQIVRIESKIRIGTIVAKLEKLTK